MNMMIQESDAHRVRYDDDADDAADDDADDSFLPPHQRNGEGKDIFFSFLMLCYVMIFSFLFSPLFP